MHEDYEYVKSLEKEVLLLEECVSKDVTCSYLHSLSDLNAYAELQCLYLHKVKECECLAQKLSKQTESVNKEVHNNLLKSFAKLEKHSISLELSLQHCKEQMKNNPVCKENASNVFRKEREQYHEIQDLKAQMQDKNMVINELKKLILVTKGKSVETQFDKPSVVRQPNAQRIPKPSVLGKPTPFSNSPEMRSFQTKQSVNKTNVSDGLFKPVTQQSLPQNRNQAVRNTNVLKPGMYRIASTTTQTRTPQLPHASRNTNPHMSKSSGVIHTTSVSRPQLKSYQVKDKFAPILGYGDLIQGNVMIKRVFYVKGLNHNLFSVGQFCDADLEVAFRKSTCFVRDLQGNELLTDSRGSDLYTISLQETSSPTPICLPKLTYVKDQLCSSCEMSKAKRSSFKSKAVPSSKGRLNLLHMDLCGPMRVASINGKKYILVIVDDYSRYTWTLFLRSKDETPEVLKDFLTMIQRNLQAQVLLSNGVVERRNRTLVEAARTMLSASKLPLSFWAEAVATACYTQNRSIIISTHGKTAYHIINDRKPSIKHLHIFGCTCYITRDGENLDKMKEKGDPCVMVGYSTQSKGYRVYNKRTRLIVESIHIKFDEIKEMMSDHNSSDLAPQRQEMSVENVSSGLVPQGQKASDYDNSDPVPPRQNVVPSAEKTDSSQQGLEFLFSPLIEEYYTPTHDQAEENNNDQALNASF
ncbi:retrovirus-related pol polyprotein from transposon TNT 1-94 [Tanacetum coccineum]